VIWHLNLTHLRNFVLLFPICETIFLKLQLSDLQEKKTIRPTFSAERIFGGVVLAMCSSDFICFYDWADCRLIRRIDVNVKVSSAFFIVIMYM
jgi:hypothetical protein